MEDRGFISFGAKGQRAPGTLLHKSYLGCSSA